MYSPVSEWGAGGSILYTISTIVMRVFLSNHTGPSEPRIYYRFETTFGFIPQKEINSKRNNGVQFVAHPVFQISCQCLSSATKHSTFIYYLPMYIQFFTYFLRVD